MVGLIVLILLARWFPAVLVGVAIAALGWLVIIGAVGFAHADPNFQLGLVLLSGIVGRIWTIRRDYPSLRDPSEFREWAARGMARVLFASWTEPSDGDGAALVNETRVDAVGRRGRWGLAAVRPLIAASNGLIASDGLSVAVRRAEDAARVGR